MEDRGITEGELKTFRVSIHACEKILDPGFQSDSVTLEETRVETKDQLSLYRRAAELVANGLSGRNVALERELRIGSRFPVTDNQVKAYVTGLPKIIKKHSARLALRGFSKEEQHQLEGLIKKYRELLAARGKQTGNARAAQASRDAAFEMLRTQTSYFRRVGRATFMNSAARADFDRVKVAPKHAKKAAPPAKASAVA